MKIVERNSIYNKAFVAIQTIVHIYIVFCEYGILFIHAFGFITLFKIIFTYVYYIYSILYIFIVELLKINKIHDKNY